MTTVTATPIVASSPALDSSPSFSASSPQNVLAGLGALSGRAVARLLATSIFSGAGGLSAFYLSGVYVPAKPIVASSPALDATPAFATLGQQVAVGAPLRASSPYVLAQPKAFFQYQATATFAGAGNLSASAPATQSAVLSGAGGFVADARPYYFDPQHFTFAGAGSMVASASFGTGTATLSGSGHVTVTAWPYYFDLQSYTFAGSGALSAYASVGSGTTAPLAGTGGMTAAGMLIEQGAAILIGAGQFLASAPVQAGASLGGAGHFVAVAAELVRAVFAAAGNAVVTAVPYYFDLQHYPFAGAGSMVASASVGRATGASLAGVGAMNAVAATLLEQGTATLTGAGAVTPHWQYTAWQATAVFTAAGSEVAVPATVTNGAAVFAGAGLVGVDAAHQPHAAAQLSGQAVVVANASHTPSAASSLAAVAAMSAAAIHSPSATVVLAGEGAIQTAPPPPRTLAGRAALSGQCLAMVDASHTPFAECRMAGKGGAVDPDFIQHQLIIASPLVIGGPAFGRPGVVQGIPKTNTVFWGQVSEPIIVGQGASVNQ